MQKNVFSDLPLSFYVFFVSKATFKDLLRTVLSDTGLLYLANILLHTTLLKFQQVDFITCCWVYIQKMDDQWENMILCHSCMARVHKKN